MKSRAPLFLMPLALAAAACGSDEEPSVVPAVSALELLPGGTVTNQLLGGDSVFKPPVADLSEEEERAFHGGNSFFNQNWVQAPASTTARDGLGPTFNARSCSGCHFKDGRGSADIGDGELGLLLRLSVPGTAPDGGPLAHDRFGGQLQDSALPDVPAEGTIQIDYEELDGTYGDGTEYSLRSPTYSIADPLFDDTEDLLISPRVAPAMIGLGLLEAIPEERLLALADPDDEDEDGISGRLNYVPDVELGEKAIGRFGWKNEQPTVKQQAAGAFLGDMGLTTSLFPEENCPAPQLACNDLKTEDNEPEVSDSALNQVAAYSRSLAVPARRDADDPTVVRGRARFYELGCDDCHTPSHQTGEADIGALSDQTIWPYTDLLLHDMGPGLSDNRPSYDASGEEWRTPPLWGVGLIKSVNGHTQLLHDGRARSVAEAILWHGGEAEPAADGFRSLEKGDRKALIAFVNSL